MRAFRRPCTACGLTFTSSTTAPSSATTSAHVQPVCIFAYGQTGSGKTYTMMGNPELDDQKGLIPRSLEQIFQASQTLNARGWKYKIQVSMLEIYNEAIKDLLVRNCQNGASSKYSIRHEANGDTFVPDLTVVDVISIDEVSSLLRRAAQMRLHTLLSDFS
ncbi:hypothetical protein U9M48_011280 [Paspalum notatum var. saurae]|uniref:Kinesin motor domain-containing protein n=1 Tax=Paspalum notatum var. saurae TaxID=547442 RepID=A0AAQ3WH04_PASNO